MSGFNQDIKETNNELQCVSCGAILKFNPGAQKLKCEYCGAENDIIEESQKTEIIETPLDDKLFDDFERSEQIESSVVKCNNCGAESTLNPNLSSDRCPFCDTSLIIKGGTTKSIHKPEYLLPFKLEARQATENFKKWAGSLWFAPDKLIYYASAHDKLNGMYIPFWTFDCNTISNYSGQRGDDYFETQTYTVNVNGRNETRTRSVRRTRWTSVSGIVNNDFDDILIVASKGLPRSKTDALEPWDLENLTPYNDKFLSGFRTEIYQLGLKEGFNEAKTKMSYVIANSIKRDIGGDRQNIFSVNTSYNNPTFKHILLPIWISSYKYGDKIYRFMINARTGEVQGERPYSPFKIAFAVFSAIFSIAAIAIEPFYGTLVVAVFAILYFIIRLIIKK